MSPHDLQHFLVIYDIPGGEANVEPFGSDYEAALHAYEQAEHVRRDDPDVEVVLLGSDSVDTLARTHASYFQLSGAHIDKVVARELAELGLR
jgi:hypothetical protein